MGNTLNSFFYLNTTMKCRNSDNRVIYSDRLEKQNLGGKDLCGKQCFIDFFKLNWCISISPDTWMSPFHISAHHWGERWEKKKCAIGRYCKQSEISQRDRINEQPQMGKADVWEKLFLDVQLLSICFIVCYEKQTVLLFKQLAYTLKRIQSICYIFICIHFFFLNIWNFFSK